MKQAHEKNRSVILMTSCFAILIVSLAAMFLVNLGLGSTDITFSEIADILTGKIDSTDTSYLIIQRIRLPRLLASFAGGAALAIAGLLMQSYFANPIVEPYILGVASGSSMFVGLVMLGGYTFGISHMTPFALFSGAFIGAMVVMLIILLAAARVKSVVSLLIIGLMAGYACSGVTSILSAFADREQLAAFSMWNMGSFAGFTWQHIRIMYLIIIPMLILAFLLAKPLDVLSMGDRYAKSMGINTKMTRYALILMSSTLTAAVTAFAGPVSFIGLAVPHICRIAFRTARNRILIPAAILGGAVMASLCDFAARYIISPLELPLGAVTALIGTPIVVFLMMRKEKL